jgi:phage shock protein A
MDIIRATPRKQGGFTMSIWRRFRDLTAASVNNVLDQAEDPVNMLNQFLRDMKQGIEEAEVAVAKQITLENEFKRQYMEVCDVVEKREEQALKALESGNEDLATRTLQEKREQQMNADTLKFQYENAKSIADELRQQLREMKEEFTRMQNKKNSLVARAEAAKVQKQISVATSRFGTQNIVNDFDRMSQKVSLMEAEAKARKELTEKPSSLDDELRALENDNIEEDLASLKAKLEKKKG